MSTGPQAQVAGAPPVLPSQTPTPLPAPPPPEDSGPATKAELSAVMNAVTQLTQQFTITPEQHEAMRQRARTEAAEAAAAESQVTPGARAWKAAKWAGGILIGGAVALFGAGIAYQEAIGNNATKADIETHVTEDLEPVKADVKQIQEDLAPVKTGVEKLVKTQEDEHEVKKAKRKLKRHAKEHLHSLEEYAADKAAGRRSGPRPTKTPAHIDLEDKVEELEDKL